MVNMNFGHSILLNYLAVVVADWSPRCRSSLRSQANTRVGDGDVRVPQIYSANYR